MGFFGWVVLVGFVFVLFFVYQQINIADKKSTIISRMSSMEDFNYTQKYISTDGSSGIAIDEYAQKACLVFNFSPNVSPLVTELTYQDFISSEIIENGLSVTTTARASQVAGALVGGILLGGAGAIIGGLSSDKKSFQKINSIDLRVTVNKTDFPVYTFNFMNIECSKDSFIYSNAMQQALHWHGLISIFIRQADSKHSAVEQNENQFKSLSVSDEIRKLSTLHDDGLISSEEFSIQRNKLLNS